MVGRAPLKYADSDRTLVTPEWLRWNKARKEEIADEFRDYLVWIGEPEQNFFPEDFDKDLPEEGGWVFVIDVPHTALKFDVPVLSIWYAVPSPGTSVEFKDVHFPNRLVEIITPAGTLRLYPHEYTKCSMLIDLLGEPGVEMNALGGRPILDEERVFYLQQRGYDMTSVIRALVGEVKQPDLMYVTLPEYAVEIFQGVGTFQPLASRMGVAT